MASSFSSSAAFIILLALMGSCLPNVHAFSQVGPFGGAPHPSSSTLCMALQQLDDSNMKDLLFRPSDGRAVLVDACAPWCGPCKLIEPYLEECAKIYSEKLSVIKYDVEGKNNKNLKVEMLLQGVVVRGLPTLLLYGDGMAISTRSGAITEKDLREWLDCNLASREDAMITEIQTRTGDNPKKYESNEVAAVSKRGFVSFAAFGKDEYTL